MISENLCYSAVLLEYVATFAGIFRKGVEEVESCAVWIHSRLNGYAVDKVMGRQFKAQIEN